MSEPRINEKPVDFPIHKMALGYGLWYLAVFVWFLASFVVYLLVFSPLYFFEKVFGFNGFYSVFVIGYTLSLIGILAKNFKKSVREGKSGDPTGLVKLLGVLNENKLLILLVFLSAYLYAGILFLLALLLKDVYSIGFALVIVLLLVTFDSDFGDVKWFLSLGTVCFVVVVKFASLFTVKTPAQDLRVHPNYLFVHGLG